MLGSVFLINLLCAMVPCDPINKLPEIETGISTGRGKRLVSEEDYPVVETRNGKVKGYPMWIMSGRKITAFEGIPYADVALRFQESVPARNWTGIKEAFQPGPYCLQLHAGKMFRVVGSEKDCLSINVYTPKVKANGTLPVIAFIHGGSFAFGAGAEFGPSYLLEKNVVLVSMNYRLGVLGFLSTGDSIIPGNNGLKDQALALKWIHDNIVSFGGNPTQITVLGQSAGAVSTHLHLMSNKTREYFQRAVIISGSAHTHWGIQSAKTARKWTKGLAHLVNCPSDNSTELLNCLRTKDSNWIVAAQMNLFDWIPFPPVLFAPVIEPFGPSAFISESPEAISKSGREYAIPVIFSMTSQEGFLANYALNGLMKVGGFINDVKKYLPYYLDYHYITNETSGSEVTEKVLKFYAGDTKPRNIPLIEYGNMGTDRMFSVSINKAIKYHSRTAPTYASFFSFLGKYNVGLALGVPANELGVAHTEDLYYLFNASLYIPGFQQKDREAELSKLMVNLVTNFVSKGEPLYTSKDGKDLSIWDPVDTNSSQEIQFLQLDKNVYMIDDPFVKRRKFWESLGLDDMKPTQS